MRVGAVSLGWSGTPLDEVFDQVAATGGECIELNSQAEKHHGVPLTRENFPKVRRAADDAGLRIGSLSGYSDFAQTDGRAIEAELERLLGACRAAAELRVPLVRAFVGEPKNGVAFADVRPTVVEAFRSAAERCRELGVTLGIENHGRLVNDGAELAALVRDIDAVNVGLTIDTGNFGWAGHDSRQTEADFAAALPFVVNVHVKDGVWKGGGFEFVPAGEGELDIAGLLRGLRQRGYVGPVYSEYEGAGDFVEGTRRSISFLKRALDQAQ